ncbi:Transposase [Oopsacas minuta]|uniref:Transposase n=1 Tax=Oopsacas minuta TaxID=111878 RepID=A0AAV7JKS1_9METZ|nr:Transposase [Oopsacas minuta]
MTDRRILANPGILRRFFILLLKNSLYKLRNWQITLLEIVFPLILIILLSLLRVIVPVFHHQNTQSGAKALPSAGLIPFLQTFYCDLTDNSINGPDGAPLFEGARVDELFTAFTKINSISEKESDETLKSSLQVISSLIYLNSHPSLISQSSLPSWLQYISTATNQDMPSLPVEVAKLCSIDPGILMYIGIDSDLCNSVDQSSPDVHKDLEEVYKDIALPYSTVVDWTRRFREGRVSIGDGARIGPVSSASDKNILEVSALLEEDHHITLVEIADAVGISTGTAQAIVHDNMKFRKICARWVPHLPTQVQKAKRIQCATKLLSEFDRADSRRLFEIVTGDETWVRYSEPLSKEANKVWVVKGQDPPMIPRHDFRDPKICIPKYQTIAGSFNTNECLTEVEKLYQNRRPRTGTRGLRILHDNARPHKTKLVREKLEAMKIVELDHPPY